jgi:hypothetical protein
MSRLEVFDVRDNWVRSVQFQGRPLGVHYDHQEDSFWASFNEEKIIVEFKI